MRLDFFPPSVDVELILDFPTKQFKIPFGRRVCLAYTRQEEIQSQPRRNAHSFVFHGESILSPQPQQQKPIPLPRRSKQEQEDETSIFDPEFDFTGFAADSSISDESEASSLSGPDAVRQDTERELRPIRRSTRKKKTKMDLKYY